MGGRGLVLVIIVVIVQRVTSGFQGVHRRGFFCWLFGSKRVDPVMVDLCSCCWYSLQCLVSFFSLHFSTAFWTVQLFEGD